MPRLATWIQSAETGRRGRDVDRPRRRVAATTRRFFSYARAERFARSCTDFFTLAWAPWKRGDTMSMYTNHTGLGLLNPLNVVPLYTLFRTLGGTDDWWDIVFTPYYTASFLVDELRPFPAVFGPIIEAQIPLNPTPDNSRRARAGSC